MNDKQTCQTCSYYTRNPKDLMGSCSCPKFLITYNPKPEMVTPDSVLVEADEGWGFSPGPLFGCIHHATMEISMEISDEESKLKLLGNIIP